MFISPISVNSYKQSFGELKITDKAQKILESTLSPTQLESVNTWKDELGSSKHFDLEISDICDDLLITFKNKKNPQMASELPLRAWQQKGDTIIAVASNILDCSDYDVYNLKFKNANDAIGAYGALKSCEYDYHSRTNFDEISWAVDNMKILEETFDYMENASNEDFSDEDNSKNSWLKSIFKKLKRQ